MPIDRGNGTGAEQPAAAPETTNPGAGDEAPGEVPPGGVGRPPNEPADDFSADLGEVGFADTLSAFEIVRRWLDQGGVPQLDGTPLPQAWVASVIVRHEDRIVGQHTAVAQSELETGETLRQAASRAIARAVSQLEGPPDALRRERLISNLGRSRLSIELSTGAPVPLAEGVSAAEIDRWLRPGIEGMLLSRHGFRRARTPAQMLASGSSASATLVTLVAELADDPAAALTPYEQLTESGYALYFFRVRHAAQTTPLSTPLMLHRGAAVAPAVRTSDLASLADEIAAHIRRRAWPGVERLGLRDDYDPVAGRFASGGATPLAQALAAESLLRYAELPMVDLAERAQARRTAHAALASLAVVEGDEQAPWSKPVYAAACVNALAALRPGVIEGSDELIGLRDRCVPVLEAAYSDSKGFDETIPEAARGVAARALVSLATLDPASRDRRLSRAESAIRGAFRDTPPSRLLGLMPDLAWADIELSRRLGTDPASAPALRALRTQLLDLRLTDADLTEADRDLAGGFVLDTGSNPLPTWQSARAVALLGTMLGEPTLTRGSMASGEVTPNLIDLSEALRFIAQLTAGDRIAHMYADPDLAVGGVREALWDQSMPLTASALGLRAVTETLESMERIKARVARPARRESPGVSGRP